MICRSSALAQLALADDDEARVRDLAHARAPRRRRDALAFVRRPARRRCRRPARRAAARTRACASTVGCLSMQPDVDAVVDGRRSRSAAMPSATSIAAIASRRRDEDVDLPVLPPRERVALQMKVDAARGDEQRPRGAAASPSCSAIAASATRHRIVRVHDVGLHVADDARQLPGRRARRTRCAARSRRSAGPRCARRRSSPASCATSTAGCAELAQAGDRAAAPDSARRARSRAVSMWSGLDASHVSRGLGRSAAPRASRTSGRRSARSSPR